MQRDGTYRVATIDMLCVNEYGLYKLTFRSTIACNVRSIKRFFRLCLLTYWPSVQYGKEAKSGEM